MRIWLHGGAELNQESYMPFPTTITSICTATACFMMTLSTATYASDASIDAVRPIDRAINDTLKLKASWNTRLRVNETPEQDIRVSIPIDNLSYTLELEPYSTRDDSYQVMMQNDEGELYEVPAGPVRTLRGSIAELDGSVAAGSLMEDGLYVRIRLASGEEIWMEPVGAKIDGVASDVYALYRTDDIIPSGGLCAAEDHMDVGRILQMQANYQTQNSQRGIIICTAQLGVDTDYEYYQDWGSQTESRINQVINSVNVQYEDEVQLSHLITTIIVRSSSSDPYSSYTAETILDEFRDEWNSNQGSIARDVAHLFTGKNISGGTIGIAWLGVVCWTNSAYSLVQSDCCGSFGCTTDLSAHELGHNWGAGHVESPSFNTMYPSLQCANLFAQSSIDTINSYASGSNCLSCANQAPTGACCVGNNCIEIYQTNCDAGGGIWQGNNTQCANVSCLAPTGACCVDGTCYVYEETECNSAGGSYAGDNALCADTGCTLGACCIDTNCSLTLQLDCGGSWFGDNSNCGDITCGAGTDQLNYELSTWSRSDGQSMETYDLFFPSTDPNTRMVSVFGENADYLEIRLWSNADFDGSASPVALHHSPYGSDIPHDRQLDAPFGDDLVYDSYVTVGSTDSAVGEPMLLGFDSAGFNSSAGVYMDNGIWFVMPDDPIASLGAGSALGHRLASLSVESGQGIEILTNVQWFDGTDTEHQTRNIAWNNFGLGGGSNCPTDIDGSGATDVGDLLAMIADWGPCSGCAGDLDGNGSVDVSDLLTAIGAWGPCE